MVAGALALGGFALGCAADNPAFGKSPAVGTGDGSGDAGSDDHGSTGPDDGVGTTEQVDGGGTTGDEDGGSSEGGPPGTDTGESFEPVRCKALLWGVNEAGTVMLIDVRAQTSQVTAQLGENVWAAATARNGMLVVTPKGANPPVLGFNPMTGALVEELLEVIPIVDEASRAAMHPDGTMWLGTFGADDVPSQLLRVDLEQGSFEPIIELEELPEGGDHILTDDSTMISVGFDGQVAVLAAVEDDDPVFIFVGPLGPPGSRWTGIARADGDFWGAESNGQMHALVQDLLGGGFSPEKTFATETGIDDLAPVVLGAAECPYGVEGE